MAGAAAGYCRISRDAEQEGLGVERQRADIQALAARLGVELGHVYVDNDISASTLSKKPRPDFDALRAAVEAGEVSVVLAYSNSRLTRRPLELEDLITLHDKTGVAFHTVVSGSDDLSTADGRMVARIKASVDAAEAERASERLRRKFLEKAQNGTANQGVRPFGWAADKKALDPREARLLRRAIQDVLDGVPTREIARRWNAAGVRTSRGNAWTHGAIRAMLGRPRLAGWRTHQGKIARGADGAPVRGVWTPMVDQETYDALQGVLDGRRTGSRRGAQKYLLSGVCRCSVCGARLHATKTPSSYAYQCCREGGDHSLSITGPATDDLILTLVTERLAAIDLTRPVDSREEWAGAERLRAIPGQIRELMEAFGAGVLSGAIVFPQVQALEAEQAELEREKPSAPRKLDAATPEAFPTLSVEKKRAVIETLVEAVVVGRAERRGMPWTPDRLRVVWR